MAADPDCPFCAIVAGSLPSRRIDADDATVAFLDLHPASAGHALVVPRAHARDLLDVGAGDLAAVAAMAQRVARRATERLGAAGVNLLNSCGAPAGQTVWHFHVHVIPRYPGDGLGLPWAPGDPGSAALDELAARLAG